MATAFNTRKRIRRFFGHIESVAPMPNLIEVQKSSYEGFLQRNIAAAKRTQSGLQEVFLQARVGGLVVAGRHQDSLTTRLFSWPRPSMVVTRSWPSCRSRFGSWAWPTPPGVPVAITSPGFSVMMVEM